MSHTNHSKRFAIAVSFPGEHRRFVLNVVRRLAEVFGAKRIFYDKWYEAELIGLNGDLKLSRYYKQQSEIVVPFFSEHYTKPWCAIEWRAIRAMLMERRNEDAVIPVELDGTRIEGWESVDFAIRRKNRTGKQIADLIIQAYRHRRPKKTQTSHQEYNASSKSINITNLPVGARKLFGREEELEALDQALEDVGIHMVELVAWGGVGKSALVAAWMAKLAYRGWPEIDRYFDWSFYSQGTRDMSTVSAEQFIAEALEFFGDAESSEGSPHDRGNRLAEWITRYKTVLVLDGLEPLQFGSGPFKGQLKDPALLTMLKGLAQRQFYGLCVITTREELADLKSFHAGTVRSLKLMGLSESDGAKLLHHKGANRRGNRAISYEDKELHAISREVNGHALTLNLLGGYLKLAHKGNIERYDRIQFEKADKVTQGGHAFRVIAAYEQRLKTEIPFDPAGDGVSGHCQLAILRLLGLFDRPASAGNLVALRRLPIIESLTECLVHLSVEDWNITVSLLVHLGLVSIADDTLDTHPLVREYFADKLKKQNLGAWTEGHRRLFEHLCDQTEQQPESIEGMQQLYQAVSHGCYAGLACEAFDNVYRRRIHRGEEFFSTMSLGLFLSELQAIEILLDPPKAIQDLGKERVAFLRRQRGYCFRSIGRLSDANHWTQLAYDLDKSLGAISDMATDAASLATLKMIMGDLKAAEQHGRHCIELAHECHSPIQSFYLSTLGTILHYRGEYKKAEATFNQSIEIAKKHRIERERHLSTRVYRHCELLIELGQFKKAKRWAGDILKRLETSLDKHARGLQYVTLGRAVLCEHHHSNIDVFHYANKAVELLRSGGHQYDLIAALLLRYDAKKELSFLMDTLADLDEAFQIARRDGMRLMEAECLIRLIALPHDQLNKTTQKMHQRRIEEIIAETGYNRKRKRSVEKGSV